MAEFIRIYPDVAPPELCRDIVKRFNADSRRHPSVVSGGQAAQSRTGTMLDLSGLAEWKDVRDFLSNSFLECLRSYVHDFPSLEVLLVKPFVVPGFVIERIDPGQGFNWHIDAADVSTVDRFLAGILYLETIPKGGRTEFQYQKAAVTPQQGSVVLFPPYWTHLHRGEPPVGKTKYNITTFFVLDREQ